LFLVTYDRGYMTLEDFQRKAQKVIKNPGVLYTRLMWNLYIYQRNRIFAKQFVPNGPKEDAIMFGSFSKSGSTVFRLMWFNIIALSELDGMAVDFQVMEDNMPYKNLYEDLTRDWNFKTLPCLLKTHDLYDEMYDPFPLIHVFRNPIDAMISNYSYSLKRRSGPNIKLSFFERQTLNSPSLRFEGSFYEYVETFFDFYCLHLKSWMQHDRVLPITFEGMLASNEEATEHFQRIFSVLNLTIEESIISEAIQRSRPEHLKEAKPPKQAPDYGEKRYIRKGTIGQKEFCGEKERQLMMEKLTNHSLNRVEAFPKSYQSLVAHSTWKAFVS